MGMIIYKTGRELREVYSFEGLKRFDGSIIEADNLRLLTVIPISHYEHRQSEDYVRPRQGKNYPFINAQQNESITTFLITDDWGDAHLLEIPSEMVDAIEAAKAAIIANKIPANF